MHGLRHVELMQDLVCHFLDRPRLGVHQDIGLAVEWLAFGEKPADPAQRIGTLEKWPVGLVAHAVPDGFR
jgi:hypothetical protein